jgi:hypothetical protein
MGAGAHGDRSAQKNAWQSAGPKRAPLAGSQDQLALRALSRDRRV